MSAHEITMYQVKCDCCGVIETEYGDFAAFDDFGIAQSNADGWEVIGDEDLCPSCWCWPAGWSDPLRPWGGAPHARAGAARSASARRKELVRSGRTAP